MAETIGGDGSRGMSFGARMRLHRRRADLTQEEAAGLAGVSLSLWRKWEQGTRAVDSFAHLVNIAEALRVADLRELTGLPMAMSPGGEPRHESVGPLRAVLARHPVLLPAAEPPNVDRLATRVQAAWQAAQDSSPWRYAHTGAVLPELIADVEVAVRAGVDRRRAARLAGAVYLLARAWAKWVGEHDLALLCAERSLTAADRSDDPGLLAAAAWNMAQALSTRGEATEAQLVVEDALAAVAGVVAADSAPAHLVSAWGALQLIGMVAAVRLDDRPGAQERLRQAARAAARVGDDRNDWWLAFGPTNVAIHRVSYAVELGQSRTAVRAGAGLLVQRAPSVERRVTHRLDVAAAQTRLRQDEPALRALLAGEQESPEQIAYSPRARGLVREMLGRESSATRPLLRPLAERLGVLA